MSRAADVEVEENAEGSTEDRDHGSMHALCSGLRLHGQSGAGVCFGPVLRGLTPDRGLVVG